MSDNPTDNTTQTQAQGQEPGGSDDLPEWARKQISDANAEAAKYRTQKNDAVEAAKTETRAEVVREYEGKLSEKETAYSELESTHQATSLELLKLKAILAEGIPSEDVLEVAELVQGTDEETVSASVKRVKALLGKAPASQSPVDLSQGTGGGVPPLNGDPVLNILKAAVKAK
ncbi:putative scaffolding protein [Mycobacterium phage PP]|uniref:Putative scaffolding protein n=1 Tax=Mycobacterium phage PP TaxID=2077134 RepID=A0A2Z5XVE1_9CAUD|nr:putative scaffolding protein [Mycobacterium phage PP]BBC53818.1 putative scaffolding protein [Mycobacterium phage PP]